MKKTGSEKNNSGNKSENIMWYFTHFLYILSQKIFKIDD
jgi:hypothetical protein